VLAFGTGALGFLAAGIADVRRRFAALAAEPLPVPDGAAYDAWPVIAARAAFPSTVGVSVLGVVALPIEPTLTALLAGILAGMGLAGFATGLWLAWLEREQSVRMYRDRAGHLFTLARASHPRRAREEP
jgi:hypothetical protein